MRSAGPESAGYRWPKWAVFGLLVLNAGIYLDSGTLTEGIDSIAWLALLLLFQLETGSRQMFHTGAAVAAVHGVRLAGLAAVAATAAGFLYNNEWLDAANSGLWIAVVVLLEVEVRRPVMVAAHRALFAATAAMLYAGLGALVVVWAWRGDWFGAYDAALWLVAFVTIEMNVLAAAQRSAAGRVPARLIA